VYALVVFVVDLRMAAAYFCDCRGFWTLNRQESLMQQNVCFWTESQTRPSFPTSTHYEQTEGRLNASITAAQLQRK